MPVFETGAISLSATSPIAYWRKVENTIPIRLRVPFAFQAATIPDRLTFHIGGVLKVLIPIPFGTHRFQGEPGLPTD